MIISHGRRYIFVHIPKTGGTALTTALEGRAMKDDILIGDTPKAIKRRERLKMLTSKGRLWKHSTLADIEGVVSLQDFDDFFLFCLVRNPWDRAVSYYHWLGAQSFDHLHVGLAKTLTFAAFLQHKSIYDSFQRHSYGSYMQDSAGNERKAHFLRIEHLAEDLPVLEKHLGFSLGEVPRVNASNRARDFRGYYDESTRQTVGFACAEDIARFGYEF